MSSDLEIPTRYDFNPHDGEEGMEVSPNGDYVHWDDYYKLLKQYRAARDKDFHHEF